jgi:hypothetical protein
LQLLLLGPELEDVVLPSEDAEVDELLLSACAAAAAATATATAEQYIRCFMPISPWRFGATDRAAEAAQSVERQFFSLLR